MHAACMRADRNLKHRQLRRRVVTHAHLSYGCHNMQHSLCATFFSIKQKTNLSLFFFLCFHVKHSNSEQQSRWAVSGWAWVDSMNYAFLCLLCLSFLLSVPCTSFSPCNKTTFRLSLHFHMHFTPKTPAYLLSPHSIFFFLCPAAVLSFCLLPLLTHMHNIYMSRQAG